MIVEGSGYYLICFETEEIQKDLSGQLFTMQKIWGYTM
jgi:hypothetical protein